MSKFTCLLIEDSHTQANILSQMIMKAGWTVFAALNLNQAIGTLKSQPIDLVVTDLYLPDCEDGRTVGKIKETNPEVAVIAMTAGGAAGSSGNSLMLAKADGAEFLLQKPFEWEKLKSTLDEMAHRLQYGGRKLHVLVIDDSKTMCVICRKMLEANGFRVTHANSIEEAFETSDALDIDVILTDLHMEGMDPKEAIPIIRENMPGVGIVAMTGINGEMLSDALKLGADTALYKPFGAQGLVAAVRNAHLLATMAMIEKMENQAEAA
ncbi:MAG: response regulator [Pseudomonadota bacterium]